MAKVSLIESATLSLADEKFWGETAVANPTYINYTYSLGLLDLVTWKNYELKNADPAARRRGSAWFQFPTPPQTYELSENAAVNIIPTQNGGKFIESHGSVFKDIRLTGTVGLRPSAVDSNLLPAGVTQTTGLVLSMPKSLGFLTTDERGLPKKEITGFDDITFLRNLFRGYWNIKKSNELARRIVMIWIYAKDNDIFVVEPLNFTATKDKGNPLSYTYNITLRALYKFDSLILKERDPLAGWQDISNLTSNLTQIIRDVTVAINQIAGAIDYISSMPFRLADVFVRETIGFMGALVNLRNTGTRFTGLNQSLQQLSDHARELQHLDAILHSQVDTTGSKKGAFTRSAAADMVLSTAEATLAMIRDGVSHAAIQVSRAVNRTRICDPLFEDSKNVAVTDYRSVYNRNGVPYTEGSPLNVNNITIPSSATEDVVGGNESLRSIAKRLLGDEAYWKSIAILNNLKPPYISTTRGDGVLSPGDKILIPKRPDTGDFSNTVPTELKTDASREALSIMGKKYGRDIKLSNGSLGTDYADLVVGQRGDLATIEGVDNIRQALMIKTSTEQGELSLHPTFGAAYPVGSKVTLSQLQEFALNTRRTFLSDPRIKDIEQLKTYAEGDVVRVYAVASIRQSNTQLPIDFTVRRV